MKLWRLGVFFQCIVMTYCYAKFTNKKGESSMYCIFEHIARLSQVPVSISSQLHHEHQITS